MPKKKSLIIKILFVFFTLFLCLYIANQSGYYESKIREEVIVTEDKIEEFEEKVKNGEDIDLTSYLDNTREDYSNKMSKLGDNLTKKIETFIASSAKVFTNIFKSLF